jgi:integrase/recombinase XerD
MKNRRQGQSRLLTKKEIQNVIQYQKGSRHSIRNICLINLSTFTGMRVGEIAKLTMGDVVNEDLSIKEQLVLRKEYTKTYQTRLVYLVHKDVRKSLTDYMNYRKECDGNVRSNPFLQDMKKYLAKPFFVSQKKSGFTPRTLQRLYKNMYKAVIGDGMVSSHSGRRTFICNLVSSGIDMKTVSTLAGHSSIQTTMNTYAKSNEIEMEKVCRNMSIQ